MIYRCSLNCYRRAGGEKNMKRETKIFLSDGTSVLIPVPIEKFHELYLMGETDEFKRDSLTINDSENGDIKFIIFTKHIVRIEPEPYKA